jgi:imidazolonepropionase-like amidohydrolase
MLINQEIGMKPADVLRNATAINSEIIGMEKSLGTLDAGKIADMVFLEANPLEDMENMAKIAGVLQTGRLVYTKGQLKTE